MFVLFGHPFAAIAAAGPLLGPVPTAQFGFLPGTLRICPGAAMHFNPPFRRFIPHIRPFVHRPLHKQGAAARLCSQLPKARRTA